MPEKLAIITGSIIAFLTAALTVFAKITFVSKNQMFDKNGKPLFQYVAACDRVQDKCADRTCAKINELKAGQEKVWKELKKINERDTNIEKTLVRIDQKILDREKWDGSERRIT